VRTVAICAIMALLASAGALAQGTDGARQMLDACMLPTYAERMACLDKLAGEASATTPPPLVGVPSSVPGPPTPEPVLAPLTAAPTQAPAPAAGKWIISETRSPVDYSPVLIATASSSAGPAGVLQLSIECRGGRTEMVIRSALLMRRAEDHVVSYSINDAPPVAVTIGLSSSGSGIALKGDVAGFLKSLPADGAIAFRVAERQGGTLEGRYVLPGIKALVARMAGPCKWPRN
jgi:hypothetical protein